MTKISVKGLTVCSPEFHAIAKKGEEQYKSDRLTKKAVKAIGKASNSGEYTSEHHAKIEKAVRRAKG